MAATDHPLKRLVSTFITEFAAWLLSTPVRAARPLNVELPADILITDQVFQVTLDDGRELVLHIEFQGRRSQPPMPWRMLEYMQRLATFYRSPLWSVVFYVGAGAGVDDTGHYTVSGPADITPLAWQYQVIRLWQMSAEGDRLREPSWRFTLCPAYSMPSNNAKRLLSCCFMVSEHL